MTNKYFQSFNTTPELKNHLMIMEGMDFLSKNPTYKQGLSKSNQISWGVFPLSQLNYAVSM